MSRGSIFDSWRVARSAAAKLSDTIIAKKKKASKQVKNRSLLLQQEISFTSQRGMRDAGDSAVWCKLGRSKAETRRLSTLK